MSDDVLARILDSTDFAVGGGSAAALAGAMAAGLAGMVARLSPGKECGLTDARYAAIADEADDLRRQLQAGAAKDADAYAVVKAAYSMPREGEQAQVARRAAIEQALVAASVVPCDNARRAARVEDLCAELAGRSNPAAASDLDVGARLAAAAVAGCVSNVDVNTSMLPGSEEAARLSKEAANLLGRGHATSTIVGSTA